MAKSANPLSNPSTILYLAAAGAGAYYAFKVLKKRSAKTPQDQFNADIEKMKQGQAEQAAAEAKRKANERATQQSTSIANPNSFAGKVARIQTILGVAVDGVPGRITNGAGSLSIEKMIPLGTEKSNNDRNNTLKFFFMLNELLLGYC